MRIVTCRAEIESLYDKDLSVPRPEKMVTVTGFTALD
jgi:hypothetical protein